MKKLLIMLIVVAMATFLFVGCIPTIPVVDEEEPEPILPASVTPVIEKITDNPETKEIINLYSSDTQYMNKAEVADGILVKGFAPKYSEVNVYVGGIVVGTSTAYGGDEEFTVFVAKDKLGVDGAKTLYATATELALAESVPSTVYAFTLDVVAPAIASAVADSDDAFITVTFDEAVDEDTAETADWVVGGTITFTFDTAELTSDKKVVKLNGTALATEVGKIFTVSCSLIEDLAENPIPADAPSVYVGVVKP